MTTKTIDSSTLNLLHDQIHGVKETPLMVLKRKKILDSLDTYRHHFPHIKPHFAVKANPFEAIVKLLIEQGIGFDCASFEEINHLLTLGAQPEDILFANPIKTEPDLIQAAKAGVELYFFDNEYELQKMSSVIPGKKVVLRINVPDTDSQVKLSQKFGAQPDITVPLFELAEKLGLKPIGFSFHVGSQCIRIQNYVEAMKICRRLYEKCNKKGFNIELLDIGGGFPVQYFEHQMVPSMGDIADALNPEIEFWENRNVKLISEPGRYFVANAGTLFTRVIGKAKRLDKFYYYLDDGLYQDFSGMVFDQCQYPIETFKQGELRESLLAGPTCDSFDIIDSAIFLPELDIGDIIAVNCMGAYSCASARCEFNGISPAKIIMI